MATPFHLTVITPEKIFFDGETTQIIVRTTEGDIGILANHTSLVASLPSGPLKVMTEDGSYRVAAVSAGLIKVVTHHFLKTVLVQYLQYDLMIYPHLLILF